ncbi:MAG TPA: hypothetical protein VHH15_21020 [Actinophytocola sp.]|nr:hypothetical protein [Actinophytocola sp.]
MQRVPAPGHRDEPCRAGQAAQLVLPAHGELAAGDQDVVVGHRLERGVPAECEPSSQPLPPPR